MAYLKVKRFFDILFALILLVFLSPLYIAIIIAIRIDTEGPILFKQERYGKGKVPFEIWKFRTMYKDTPKDIPTRHLRNPGKYITRVGRVLRRNSLDELPQVWNILMGKMSFVGPRPVVLKEHDLILERDKYGANDIRPGLTGWAQINGRDKLARDIKAKIDGRYVQGVNPLGDLICVVKTIPIVLKREGHWEGDAGLLAQQEAAASKDSNFV